MKEIKAYIKKHKLQNVVLALRKIEGMTGLTLSEIWGFGRGKAVGREDSLFNDPLESAPGVRIELCCQDEWVDEVISTIEREAHTGLRGDGKIYVFDIQQAVRISTGERGHNAT